MSAYYVPDTEHGIRQTTSLLPWSFISTDTPEVALPLVLQPYLNLEQKYF